MKDADLSQYLEADLRFLMPLTVGQKVGVYGHSSALAETLNDDGLVVFPLLLQDIGKTTGLDHLIISKYEGGSSREAAGLFRKTIQPGGWLIVGFYNAGSIRNIFSHKKSRSCYYLREFISHLKQAGFDIRLCYGVYDRLPYPHFLIPVETSGASKYFWNSIYVPASRLFTWMQRWFGLLSTVGLRHTLFSGCIVLAHCKSI